MNSAFLNEAKKPVLVLRPAARDLIDKNAFGSPDGRRRLKESDLGFGVIREWEADQVIEADQRRVIVPVVELQGLRDGVEEKCLSGTAFANQQERVFGDESGENDEFNLVESVHAETWKNGRSAHGRAGCCDGLHVAFRCSSASIGPGLKARGPLTRKRQRPRIFSEELLFQVRPAHRAWLLLAPWRFFFARLPGPMGPLLMLVA